MHAIFTTPAAATPADGPLSYAPVLSARDGQISITLRNGDGSIDADDAAPVVEVAHLRCAGLVVVTTARGEVLLLSAAEWAAAV